MTNPDLRRISSRAHGPEAVSALAARVAAARGIDVPNGRAVAWVGELYSRPLRIRIGSTALLRLRLALRRMRRRNAGPMAVPTIAAFR